MQLGAKGIGAYLTKSILKEEIDWNKRLNVFNLRRGKK